MRNTLLSLLATTLLLVPAALATPAEAAEMEIRFSHVNTDNTPKGYAANRFAELAEQYTDGRVKVAVFPSGQLFGDGEEMEALLMNDVQIIAPSLSKFQRYTDKLQVFDLPFLFSCVDAVTKFQQSDLGKELLNSIKDRGYTGLGYIHNGMKQLSAHRAIRKPEDAKGLTFRTQPSEVIQDYFRQMGASPQSLAFSEVYQALQTGVIGGQENSWTSIYTMRFFEVQEYVMETNHGMMSFMITVATNWWESLPDDIRDALYRAAVEAADEANKAADEMHQKNRQNIVEAGGTEIITFTPEEIAVWREHMRPVWDKYRDAIGSDLIEAAEAANDAC